jgi:hypothetical protein
MTKHWMMAIATGLTISAFPAAAEAQPGRAQQERRAAERERARTDRDARTGNQRVDERDRYDARNPNARERQREGERIRAEQQARERHRERDRIRAEQARERQRDAERRRAEQRGYDFGRNGNAQQGPAFCRNGSGHPVFGRQWCIDKGFGLGADRWERRGGWDDILIRRPRDRNRQLNRSVLGDVLGGVVLGRFESYGRQHYGTGAITGHWIDERDASVLQLAIGGVPFARLVDSRRNGRIDTVLLRRR